jgi:hypothetical protein
MMERQTGDQSQLFYLFNLEKCIPARYINRVPAKERDQHQSQGSPKTQTRPKGELRNTQS